MVASLCFKIKLDICCHTRICDANLGFINLLSVISLFHTAPAFKIAAQSKICMCYPHKNSKLQFMREGTNRW